MFISWQVYYSINKSIYIWTLFIVMWMCSLQQPCGQCRYRYRYVSRYFLINDKCVCLCVCVSVCLFVCVSVHIFIWNLWYKHILGLTPQTGTCWVFPLTPHFWMCTRTRWQKYRRCPVQNYLWKNDGNAKRARAVVKYQTVIWRLCLDCGHLSASTKTAIKSNWLLPQMHRTCFLQSRCVLDFKLRKVCTCHRRYVWSDPSWFCSASLGSCWQTVAVVLWEHGQGGQDRKWGFSLGEGQGIQL